MLNLSPPRDGIIPSFPLPAFRVREGGLKEGEKKMEPVFAARYCVTTRYPSVSANGLNLSRT
jgi:hypothetical protein